MINRAVARLTLFEKQEDYEAFERVLALAHERVNLGIFAYCAMPNHWHFVVCPKTDTQVTDFFRWLTHTHTMRWHAHYHTEGTGHLYQGRFKTFPIQEDEHLVSVLRYVERNALQANLVKRAEDWKYGSGIFGALAGVMGGIAIGAMIVLAVVAAIINSFFEALDGCGAMLVFMSLAASATFYSILSWFF